MKKQYDFSKAKQNPRTKPLKPKFIIEPCVTNFADVAARYCAHIEKCEKFINRAFIKKAHALLVELYAMALTLPNVPATNTRILASVPKTFVGLKRILKKIQKRTHQHDFHWEIFDPYDDKDHEPVCGWLADDFADIYRDIKTGLVAFEKGTPKAISEAVWQWRFSFWSHWGEHATGAIHALYWAQRKREL